MPSFFTGSLPRMINRSEENKGYHSAVIVAFAQDYNEDSPSAK
jgi:hypothetical protein